MPYTVITYHHDTEEIRRNPRAFERREDACGHIQDKVETLLLATSSSPEEERESLREAARTGQNGRFVVPNRFAWIVLRLDRADQPVEEVMDRAKRTVKSALQKDFAAHVLTCWSCQQRAAAALFSQLLTPYDGPDDDQGDNGNGAGENGADDTPHPEK